MVGRPEVAAFMLMFPKWHLTDRSWWWIYPVSQNQIVLNFQMSQRIRTGSILKTGKQAWIKKKSSKLIRMLVGSSSHWSFWWRIKGKILAWWSFVWGILGGSNGYRIRKSTLWVNFIRRMGIQRNGWAVWREISKNEMVGQRPLSLF